MGRIRRNRLGIIIGSLAITIWVGSQYLNDILNLYIGYDRGFFTLIIVLASALSVLSLVLCKRIIVNQNILFLIAIILLLYVFTNIVYPGRSALVFVDLLGMCLLPLLFGSILVLDFELIFKCCMSLLLLAIPVYQNLFLKANIGFNYDAVSMSTSYDILPICIVGVIHLVYFGKNSTVYDKILYVISIIFSLSLIRMSYRGALVALFVSIFTAVYFRKKQGSLKNQIRLLVIGILIITLIINYRFALTLVSGLLEMLNIRIAFIDKTLYLLEYNSFGHGRIEIYSEAFKGFLHSPLWGNGMATFQYYTGYIFPHNFILEFLFDGGLIFSIPILIVFINAFKNLRKYTWRKDRFWFAFSLMIGSISITRGLVSAESWRIILMWLFIGLCFNNARFGNEVNEEK